MGEGRDLWGFRSDTLLHLESLPWVSQGQEHSLAFFPTGLGQQAAQCFWPKGHHGLSPLGKSGTVCCGRLKSLDLSEVTSLNRHQPLSPVSCWKEAPPPVSEPLAFAFPYSELAGVLGLGR